MATVLYTARVHTVGGQNGASRSADGRLDIQLSQPGSTGGGTNPEQLFAAGWSASFLGALRTAADRLRLQLPASAAIDAEIDLIGSDGTHELMVRFKVSLPGIGIDTASQLIAAARSGCPYFRATRGNIVIDVRIA
jgi:lipoyl-dependent peroxiredoxin